MTRRRPSPAAVLTSGSLEISGLRRTYWLAPTPRPGAPLLIALHGLGMTGRDMDAFTGLATRGPAAGFATVFPDGWGERWDGEQRDPERRGIDDPAFISGLVSHLTTLGAARPGAVVVVGLSNGALFAEFLARHGTLRIALLALVSGTATEQSHRSRPRPQQAAAVVCFAGTDDRVMPYDGGPIGGTGLIGRLTARRRQGHRSRRPVVVAAETLAQEWAHADGIDGPPSVEQLSALSAKPPVTLLSWQGDEHLSVRLYRIEGGGHGWPGGPQYLPALAVGRVSRELDATGIILGIANDLVSGGTE